MRSVFCGLILALLVLGGVEYAYRYAGGLPTIVPGKTTLEFKYRVQEKRAELMVYVIGDSRVDWGFGDNLFSEYIKVFHGGDIRAVNCGLPSGSTLAILNYVVNHHHGDRPGVIILNYSPASFYHFRTRIMASSFIKRQDIADHQISNRLSEKIFTFGQKVQPLYRFFKEYRNRGFQKRLGWYSRTLYPEGFVNAVSRNNDGSISRPDPAYYRRLFRAIKKDPEYSRHRMVKLIQIIHRATNAGWKIIMIRMPIDENMRLLEAALPEQLSPECFIDEVGLFFKDYAQDPRTMGLTTFGSHLIPESARIMTKVLAEDFSEWIDSGIIREHPRRILNNKETTGVVVRKAINDDKYDIFDVHRASVEALIKTGKYSRRVVNTWVATMNLTNYDNILKKRKVVVATLNGEVVGFGQLNLKQKSIDSLHVIPIRHEYKVRLKLLRFLEEISFRNTINRLTLFGSIDKIIFYKHHGYFLKNITTTRFNNGTTMQYATMEKKLF